jgi:hypothetical protein
MKKFLNNLYYGLDNVKRVREFAKQAWGAFQKQLF